MLKSGYQIYQYLLRLLLYRFYPRLRKILLEIAEKEGGAAKDTAVAYACEEKK